MVACEVIQETQNHFSSHRKGFQISDGQELFQHLRIQNI